MGTLVLILALAGSFDLPYSGSLHVRPLVEVAADSRQDLPETGAVPDEPPDPNGGDPRVGPVPREDGVVVNVPQRMLYLWREGRLAGSWPVAVGRRSWRTPLGRFSVRVTEEDPAWDVPRSIQAEMRRRGRRVVRRVPPGPNNPLGPYWIGLSVGAIGIHGTNAPDSISRFATHGCIRMRSEDAGDLYSQVEVGMPVEIVYEPVLVTVSDGWIWLEAHPDPYGKVKQPEAAARAQVEDLGVADLVDWEEAEEVLRHREGVARIVGEAPPSPIL